MRSRNIKIGFWDSEKIGQLTHTQRLLFIGLWCLADRDGKLENRPDKIRHRLFGYDKARIDINRDLTVIERLGFIHQYVIAGQPLIIIKNFKKHQSPHHTEKKSILPDPESIPGFNGELTVSHGENPPESRILNPESRILKTLPHPDQKSEKKTLTPVQQVVIFYKKACRIPVDDKGWDDTYFGRFSKPAKDLLGLFSNDLPEIEKCVNAVVEWLEGLNLTHTLETITKHASNFREGKLNREEEPWQNKIIDEIQAKQVSKMQLTK